MVEICFCRWREDPANWVNLSRLSQQEKRKAWEAMKKNHALADLIKHTECIRQEFDADLLVNRNDIKLSPAD